MVRLGVLRLRIQVEPEAVHPEVAHRGQDVILVVAAQDLRGVHDAIRSGSSPESPCILCVFLYLGFKCPFYAFRFALFHQFLSVLCVMCH